MVGVAFKSTGHTFEFRLRWPVCSVCASAMTACLAGILRRNDNQLSTQPFQLVLRLPSKPEPPLIQYGLVQAGPSAYIFTRQFKCTGIGFELLPVGGKLHSFCQPALQLCQLLFMFSETVQWFDAGAIGERCKTRNSCEFSFQVQGLGATH